MGRLLTSVGQLNRKGGSEDLPRRGRASRDAFTEPLAASCSLQYGGVSVCLASHETLSEPGVATHVVQGDPSRCIFIG